MKKRISFIFLALVLVVSLVAFAACKDEAPPVEEEEAPPTTPTTPTTPTKPTEPEPEPEPTWQWPEKLAQVCATGVGVAATTGYTAELAKDTGMAIRIVPEGNTQLRFKWVNEGRFFCVSESLTIVYDVLRAVRGHAVRDGGAFQVRLLFAYSMSNSGFIVRGDSDIKTIYDVKPGVKFVDMVFVPGMRESYPTALLAWAGVDPEDVVWVPASSYGAAMRMISGGQADISFCFPASPDVMEAAAAPHGIRFLDLQEGAKRFLEVAPITGFGVMSQSPECTGVRGSASITGLYCRADADPDLVYHYAKWLDENYDLFKDCHVWNQYMTLDNTATLTETCFLPAHDGLIKYLKEKGLWTAAHDARQAQNIELITRYCDAYQKAIDMADEKGIAVTPENEEWMELWENYKKQLGLPKIRMFTGLEE